MKKLKIFIFLSFFIFINNISAQDSLLIELLKSNSHQLHFEGDKLSGEGFDFLKKKGQQSSFFLIGENHGIAENPKFTAALFKAFKSFGYKYFATEVGPFTAQYLQEMASEKNFMEQIQLLLRKHPWSIPFYSMREECEILTAVVDADSDNSFLWGLDQEFAASFRMNFEQLQKNAGTDKSRQLATKYLEQATAAFKESAETGNPGKSFMAVVRPDDFQQLKNEFKGQEKNLELLKELEESIHIYQLWFQGGGYESNCLRAEMMKRHFWNYYSAAKKEMPQPKVMFKFGANHMYRGKNSLNVFDIGNFVSELASQEQTQSFHLYTLGKRGTQNTYTPFSKSEDDKQTVYDASEFSKKMDPTTLLAATTDDDWSVVDLRPLRKKLFNRKLKDLHPWMEKLIWNYDAVLVIPKTTASTFIE